MSDKPKTPPPPWYEGPLFHAAADDPPEYTCPFCGRDRRDPDHAARCDGRQGRVEENEPAAPETDNVRPFRPRVVTIPSKRATSAETFYNRTESGDIRTQQRRVWRALAMMGASGTTAQELAKSAGYQQRDERNVCARLTEMRNLGYVREVEERVCRERGTVVIAWAIIPRAEYLGPATTFRCPECGQTVYHKVPVSGAR